MRGHYCSNTKANNENILQNITISSHLSLIFVPFQFHTFSTDIIIFIALHAFQLAFPLLIYLLNHYYLLDLFMNYFLQIIIIIVINFYFYFLNLANH